MNTHETLVAARNLIDQEGWVQGSYFDYGYGYCIEGACAKAANGLWNVEVPLDVRYALSSLIDGQWLSVWNDEELRTKAHVVALLDEAIAQTAPEPFVELDERVEVSA